jgi:hypothetical protein
MRPTALFTVLLLMHNIGICIAQNKSIRPEIKQLVRQIAGYNSLDENAVGIAGVRTEQWERYEKLKKEATLFELKTLVDNKNAVVRCYAFMALTDKTKTNIFPVVIEHLADTATVLHLQGCLGITETVADFFLDVAPLNHAENRAIDSLLLFTPKLKLEARTHLLQKLPPDKKYYARIREIYSKENEKWAIIPLAKFRNPADIALIKSLLNDKKSNHQYLALCAVKSFPDKAFFPLLIHIHAAEIRKFTRFDYPMLRMLYQAIIQYQHMESKTLLEKTLAEAKGLTLEYHSEYIWVALKKYPHPIFDGIIQRIKLSKEDSSKLMYEVNSDS